MASQLPNGIDDQGIIQFPQPTIQPAQIEPSGFGGKTQALAMFADKFLAGVSKGRALAFQRSEQQRERSMFGLRAAMQDVQNANIPDELKQQQLAPLQQLIARMVAGVGEDGGKKGKKGGGSQDGSGNPMHSVIDAIKGFAGRMVGPGAQKQPVSTEDINAAIGQTYAGLKTTPTISDVTQKLDTTYSTIYNAQKQARGRDLTQSEQLAIPALASIASQSQQLNKGKPSAVIGGFLSTGEQREAQAIREADPLYQAQVKEAKQRGQEYESQAGYYERGGTSANKIVQLQDSKGNSNYYQAGEGPNTKVYRYGDPTPLTSEEAGKLGLKPYTKPGVDKYTQRVDKDGKWHIYNETKKQDTVVEGKFDSPGQLQASREFETNARDKAKRDAGNAKAIATMRGMFESRRRSIAAMNPDALGDDPAGVKKQLLDQVNQDEDEYDRLLKAEEENAAPPTSSTPPAQPKSGSRPPLSSFQK